MFSPPPALSPLPNELPDALCDFPRNMRHSSVYRLLPRTPHFNAIREAAGASADKDKAVASGSGDDVSLRRIQDAARAAMQGLP